MSNIIAQTGRGTQARAPMDCIGVPVAGPDAEARRREERLARASTDEMEMALAFLSRS